MKVQFYGPRGSIPTPTGFDEQSRIIAHVYAKAFADKIKPADMPDYIKALQAKEPFFFGGNTACTLVSDGKKELIIDAGSGARQLGLDMINRKVKEIHLLLGHIHWDHIQGLPFMTPLYVPGVTIHIYSVQDNIKEALAQQMCDPVFPVPFDAVASKIKFHQLTEHKVEEINGFTVEPMKLNHPNTSYGFKITKKKRTVVYLSDTEVIGADLKEYKRYQDFIGDSQVVIADAQYSFIEYFEKQSWGHSNIMTFIDMLKNNKVKKLYMFHHDPMTNFEELMEQSVMAARYKEISCPTATFEVLTACEGDEVEV